jgi:hypothetical protein
MKIILGSRIHRYFKRLSIFLITIALIVGMAGCNSGGVPCCPPLRQYDLNISGTDGGEVANPGEGTFIYGQGTIVGLIAVAEEGYRFVEWTGEVRTIIDVNAAMTNITMNGVCSITAEFAKQYDLYINSTGGCSVTEPGEGVVTYDEGTVVNLVAVADECYEFVNWSGDVDTIADVYAAETTITMDGDYSITANFEEISRYDLTITSTAGGSGTTPGEGTFNYDAGSVVDLVATPDAGYHFVNWTGNVSAIADVYAAETTITMNGHYSITANFILFAGGSGTAVDPYEIADWRHLDNVRNYLNHHFIVINDLDSNSIGYTELASATANEGKGWEPIGTAIYPFTGNLNGQGHEICDLFINRPDESEVGLFGVIEEGGVVENVGVVNVNVTGYDNTGGLAGKNSGTVSNSYSSGSVTGNANVGGLAGYNFFGTVLDSRSTGSVTGQNNVGGLVGWNRGPISNSYSTGSVSGDDNIGGLAGKNSGTVSNSYSSGSVTGNDNVGGLVGRNEGSGTVSNSYSSGGVTGNTHVGGLVGRNASTVSNSFWDTQTSRQGSSDGGIGKTTAQMQDIATFTGAGWDISAVDDADDRNTDYVWNIVDSVTYPFLSWQPA